MAHTNTFSWRNPWLRALAASVLAVAGITAALRLLDNTMMPAVTLTTLDGRTAGLPALAAGKPTVVNLWATWCAPCRLEMPFLAEAQAREPGINFFFVDQGEDATTVARYLGTEKLDLTHVMMDPSNTLGRELGVTALPITLFYDASGRMVDSRLGALSPALLAEKLARLRPPAAQSTRP